MALQRMELIASNSCAYTLGNFPELEEDVFIEFIGASEIFRDITLA
jgi:hypothetical protein